MKKYFFKKRIQLLFCLILIAAAVFAFNNQTVVGKDIIIFDNKPPHVEIRRPHSGAELKPEFEVEIYAEDNMGISTVELYVNDRKHHAFNNIYKMPLRLKLNLNPGDYRLQARAVDNSDNEEWSSIKRIRVKNIDNIPPDTSIYFEGKRLSNGVFDSVVEVTLRARDNRDGSGVRDIFFRIGENGLLRRYKGPFTINRRGENKIYFHAVDNSGNYEREQMTKVYIDIPWDNEPVYPVQPDYPEYPFYEIEDYSLVCEGLSVQGQAKLHRVFVNGRASFEGNISADHLDISSNSIDEQGQIKINKLRTGISYRNFPVPDWQHLVNRTNRRYERELDGSRKLSNVRFERDLVINNAKNISGIILVNGDLTLRGQTNLSNVGIFVTGRVNITGDSKINGLIYAAEGISLRDQLHINGLVLSNGPARLEGNVTLRQAGVKWFMRYMN